jgi:hypothetical protein
MNVVTTMTNSEARQVLAALDACDKALIEVVADVYQGDWQLALEDQSRRLSGQPYLYRLELDPAYACERIQLFQECEAALGQSIAEACAAEESS